MADRRALSADPSARAGLPWFPALDGLRAIAVAGVLLFHVETKSLFVGGFLGVDLFFVLSGFLITSILLHEWDASGRISLPGFYRRRVLRLMPAAAAFVLAYLLYVAVFHPAHVRLTAASLGWVAADAFNWPMALRIATPDGFGHLWSVAVEEQYYLVCPAFLLLMLRVGLSRSTMLCVTALLALVSAAVPLLMPGSSWYRMYYGTDFRAHELLIGSAAGQLCAAGIVSSRTVAGRPYRAAIAVAVAFLVLRLFFGGNDKAAWMFIGGFALVAVAAATIVAGCALGSGQGRMSAVLSSRPTTYLGRRSYAIYLWHLPIAEGTRGLPVPAQLAATVMLSLIAAEVSWRLVERRALRWKEPRAAGPRLLAVPAPDIVPVGAGLERRIA